MVIKSRLGLGIAINQYRLLRIIAQLEFLAIPVLPLASHRTDHSVTFHPRPNKFSPASAPRTVRTSFQRPVLVQAPLLARHIEIRLAILRRARDLVAPQALHTNAVVAPDEVRDAVPRILGLRSGGVGDPVHIAAQDAAGPLDERVAEVDDGAVGLRPDVAPGGLVGGVAARRQDLEPADGAAEEGDGADVGVVEQRLAAVGERLGGVADHAQQGA